MIPAPGPVLRRWSVLLVASFLPWLGTGLAAATVKPKTDVVVALDGSGDFKSIQEAISRAPMGTGQDDPRWVIHVKPGTYRERIHVQRERGNILVRGDDAATTVIVFGMHANMPGEDGKPIGTFRTPTLWLDGDGTVWEDLTIANDAGPVGQALAIRVDADRAVFRRCRFLGWQDTILVNRGRQYFEDCYIEGHVDFIFGAATAYFSRCHIHSLRDGYITAASTPDGAAHGMVFADCRITGAPGVKTYLGRPWRDFAKTVFLRTEMSDVVRSEGWHNWNKPNAEKTTFYAEYASVGRGANPAARAGWTKQLTAAEAERFTPQAVLGGTDGWNPVTGVAPVRIVLVGDSTVTDHAGWGAGFRQFVGAGGYVTNAALGGRSSRSYLSEGRWEPALALRGDYYLIQFGHNDQPGKGPERETEPETSFREFMAKYVDDVRAIGAQPVLVTSLTRRIFSTENPAKIESSLGPWAEAVKRLGAEKKVPVIDLHARSIALCERLGPAGTATFNLTDAEGKTDRTHLEGSGSLAFARLVAGELRDVLPVIDDVVRSPAGLAFQRDVEYGRVGDDRLLLDIRMPMGPGPFPVALLVHGGGWNSGDKAGADRPNSGADITPWFQPLTDAGFVWVSINYRLAPKHRWPACLEDVQAAIRWVKANIAGYRGDPGKIAIFGHSAGGHLAAMAATLPGEDVQVQALVGYAPVTNHEQDLAARGGLSLSLQQLLDRPQEVTPESRVLLREISPLNHIRRGMPPTLLLHGEADRTVPLQQSLDFQAKLQAHGVRCDLIVLPGAGHRLTEWDKSMPDHATRMTAWLREVLGAGP